MGKISGGDGILFRTRLLNRFGSRCYLCKEPFEFEELTLEHLVPMGRGGSVKRMENHALACDACQEAKGSLTVEEFISLYRLDPDRYTRRGVLKDGIHELRPITNKTDLARIQALR